MADRSLKPASLLHFFGSLLLMAVVLAVTLFTPRRALASEFFVRETSAENGVSDQDARVATHLVRDAVSARTRDHLTDDENRAEFILQPRLMKLGDSWVLTVEKLRGQDANQETLFAAQAKVNELDQLDRAARSATASAIDQSSGSSSGANVAGSRAPYYQTQPSYGETRSGTTTGADNTASAMPMGSGSGASIGQAPSVIPPNRKVDYWTVGAGPFLGHHMHSDQTLYDFAGGHVWDINPLVSIKVIGEANLSSGKEDAHFYNLGVGANYYFTPVKDSSPYATADMGYGYARDAESNKAEGFSFGVGAGYQFFRSTETTMDLIVRYAVIFDQINAGGNPSVTGLRLAVNF